MSALTITHRLAMLATFTFALSITGCSKKNNTPETEDSPKPPANLADAKADVTFTPNEYEAERKKNHSFLSATHPGKVIEVTGAVKSFGSFEDNRIVALESDSPIGTMFKLGDNKAWLKMLPRQTETLRAVAPTDRNQFVVNWQVITITGSATPTLTAEEILKESKVGLNAVAEKYGKGLLIVSGTIAEVDGDKNVATAVRLAADTGEKLECVFPHPAIAPIPLSEQQRNALKPGQKVKILGEPSASQMILCVLLEPAP